MKGVVNDCVKAVPAEPRGGAAAEGDRVAKRELGRALVAVGLRRKRRGRGRRHEHAVDVAGAGEVERIGLEAVAYDGSLHAEAEFVRQRSGRGCAVKRDVERAAAPALVFAAKVVEVEVAVRAEPVGVVGAVGRRVRIGAAERKGDTVVGAEVLAEPLHDDAPVVGELLRQAQRGGRRVEHHRQRPGLVVEVDLRIGHRRHVRPEQAEAGNARLRAMAVLDLGLDQRRRSGAPVAGEREHVAVAPRVANDRVDVFGAGVEAHAEGIAGAEALADVDRAEHAAALAPLDECRAQRRVERPLDDQVDQAAGRARPRLDAARALEDVDARLVLERDRGLGVDRQAVAAEVEAVVDDEAPHGEVVDVALGVVGSRHRGVEARQIGEPARAGVADLRRVDRRRRERRLLERRVAPAGDAGRHRCLARDRHRRERGLRAGRGRQPAGGDECEQRRRAAPREDVIGHRLFRWQGSGPERHRRSPVRLASLREDYLSQVQRDFLSRAADRSASQHP
jgi:hypothetical protein